MLIFSVGFLLIAGLVYKIHSAGSLLLLYGFLALYLFAVLSIGLLISTYAQNQQQSMSLAYFFIMIFVLMSGLFTPVSSMPQWAQWIAWANPVTHFIEVMRKVVIKGSTFYHIYHHFVFMIGFGIIFFTWAILNYHKKN